MSTRRKPQKRNKADWPQLCRGCGSGITECDFDAGQCTNCGKSLGLNLLDKLANERVPMLGFPQVIVTRGFCYQWLKAHGWDAKAKGFASIDYAAFGRKSTEALLTEEGVRDHLLGIMADTMAAEAA